MENDLNQRLLNVAQEKLPWVLIVLTPFIFFAINSEWLYPYIHTIDSYLNHRFGLFYDQIDFLNESYKVERVSWHIPLFLMSKAFGIQSITVFWGLFSYLALGSLFYLIIKELFNERKALLVLPFILLYPELVGNNAGGGSYHNLYTSMCFLTSLYLWVGANKATEGRRTNVLIMVSGVFLATSLVSNLILLNLGLLFFCIQFHLKKRIIWKNYVLLFGGLVLGATFWTILNFIIVGEGISFSRRIGILDNHTDPDHFFNSWYYQIKSLFFVKKDAFKYLGLYLMMVVALISSFGIQRKLQWKSYLLGFHAIFIVILWFIWHELGIQSLYPPDFSYAVQIPIFLALPLLFPENILDSKKKDLLLTLAIYFILLVVNITFQSWESDFFGMPSDPNENEISNIITLIISVGLVVGIGLSLKFKWIKFLALSAMIFFYGMVNDPNKSLTKAECPLNKEGYKFFTKVLEELSLKESPFKKYFIFNLPKRTHSLNSGACYGKILHFGVLFNALNWTLTDHENSSKGNIWKAKKLEDVIDNAFFTRLHKADGNLILLQLDYHHLQPLKEMAKKEGFSIYGERDFTVPFSDFFLEATIYKVESL